MTLVGALYAVWGRYMTFSGVIWRLGTLQDVLGREMTLLVLDKT